MFHPQGASKQSCSLLAVTCGENSGDKLKNDDAEDKPRYPLSGVGIFWTFGGAIFAFWLQLFCNEYQI
jgi:hypothetical protein